MDSKNYVLDFETCSPVDLKQHGARRYAQKASIICAVLWNYHDNQFIRFDCTRPSRLNDLKITLQDALTDGRIIAHNYTFERYIMRYVLGIDAPLDAFICTQAIAKRLALPASLGPLCKALGTKNQKDEKLGKALIRKYGKFSDPTKIPKADLEKYLAYCVDDVKAEAEVYTLLSDFENKLPDIERERKIETLDRQVNATGLRIDVPLVKKLIDLHKTHEAKTTKAAEMLCGIESGGTLTLSSPLGFKRWLGEHGLKVASINEKILKNVGVSSPKIKKAIALRKELAGSAVKKLYKLQDTVDGDTVYDYLNYCGAHTRRWAGYGFQPQNFPREGKSLSPSQIKALLAEMKKGHFAGNIGKVLKSVIIPRKGHKFISYDYAQIEPRLLFLFAGCKKGLDAFARGDDLYKQMASVIFNKPETFINDKERFVGKQAILGLGYGAGKIKFRQMCFDVGGVSISAELASRSVRAYRRTYPEVPRLWELTEKRFIFTINSAPKPRGKISFEPVTLGKLQGIKATLPNGSTRFWWGVQASPLTCIDWRKGNKKHLWGGVLVENLVQSMAREVMCDAMLSEADSVRLNVHDEVLFEAKRVGDGAYKASLNIAQLMSQSPEWAPDLPLKVEGGIINRWGKA